jgi:hypothetical protein
LGGSSNLAPAEHPGGNPVEDEVLSRLSGQQDELLGLADESVAQSGAAEPPV